MIVTHVGKNFRGKMKKRQTLSSNVSQIINESAVEITYVKTVVKNFQQNGPSIDTWKEIYAQNKKLSAIFAKKCSFPKGHCLFIEQNRMHDELLHISSFVYKYN